MGITRNKENSHRVIFGLSLQGGDNETLDMIVMSGPGLVKHVTMISASALGGSDSVDLINAGINGTATTVAQASSNDLNGEEDFDGVDDEFQDGTVFRLLADDYTAGIDVVCQVEAELYSR